MYRAFILLLAFGVGACDLSPWPKSPGPSGDLAPAPGPSRSSGYASPRSDSSGSDPYRRENPYQGGSSCTYQSSGGPVQGVRAYDRNRCCINTPAGRSCQ